MTDIEGVSGVTSFPQAENSDFGRRMLMHDLKAVISGIKRAGAHEIVVYDMHTDGRNVDLEQLDEDIPVIAGKPISRTVYRGIGGGYDGLFLLGLHSMQNVENALLAHSYLREYDAIHINGKLVGEIGVEAYLAGEQNIPLVFVSGDDVGCKEAEDLVPGVYTAVVKQSVGSAQALCLPLKKTEEILSDMAEKAAKNASSVKPLVPDRNVTVEVIFSQCRYREIMQQLHPDYFTDLCTLRISGEGMLNTWGKYLLIEQEMISASKE